ncbi:MAG: hypothetical protein Q4A28_07490 [Brachymonas sp.]|nr:hypothetical protein [Brachymonas sp.]
MPTPTTNQVLTSRKKLADAGGLRVEALLQPDAADALHTLLEQGYGASKAQVIGRALLDALNNHENKSTLFKGS